MAKHEIPTADRLMWPTILALKGMGGSEDLQNVPHGDGPKTELDYRLAWARTYLRLFGALENSSRSVWAITRKGQSVSERDVASIPRVIRRQNQSGRPAKAAGPDKNVEGIDESWKDKLLTILQTMPPSAFERLSQRLLREPGFVNVEVKGKSGDGGIDGTGVLRMRLLSFRVLFQCKRYKGSVAAKDVRDFRGAMAGRTDKGLFITTGRFTADARREATREGAPPIDLVDGEQLCELLKELKIGVLTKAVEQVDIQSEVFKAV
jgi:restriction system protein